MNTESMRTQLRTLLRSRSIDFSPTPHWAIVAFGLFVSCPSYERLCSLTGIPDFNGGIHERQVYKGGG